jgi:Xaa-Pro aminopeptidase
MLSLKPGEEQKSETNPTDSKDAVTPRRKYMISTKASWALSLELGGEEKVDELRSLVGDAKAIKNKTELEGMRACHVRDGASLSEYFAWLEEEIIEKGAKLDEVQAADKLEQIRS